jgi:hypothetical protein
MEDNKFKVMKRDIEILRELVIDFVPTEKLVDRILLLEQARTRYLTYPDSMFETEEEVDESTGQNDDYPDYRST